MAVTTLSYEFLTSKRNMGPNFMEATLYMPRPPQRSDAPQDTFAQHCSHRPGDTGDMYSTTRH